ncbi:CD99 molecule isoform X3 [Channa argus]|uniref:CD99 molecule isoform X3 n=1 Tax=Channa argus TaxID=215402 RepID=UPI00352032A5
MKFCLRIVLLLFLVTATLTQDDLDLSDALDNVGGGTFDEADFLDVSGGDYKPDSSRGGKVDPTQKPKKPSSRDSGGFGVDLDDALGPDLDLSDALDNVDNNPKPEKPAINQPKNGEGGGTFDEADFLDVSGGDYKPDSSGRGKVDPTQKPKKPSSGDSGGFGLDLDDALGTDLDLSDALDNVDNNPKPEKPAINQPKNGEGGGTFDEADFLDVSGGDYKPDSSGRGKVDPTQKPKKPSSGDSGGFGLDLDDALGTDLDLSDALDNVGGGTFVETDLLDVSGGDYKPDSSGRGKVDPTQKPKKPSSRDSGGFGVDLDDALGPDLDLSDALDNVDNNPKPDKPAINQPKNGEGGGTFDEADFLDVSGGDYKPDSSGRGKVDPTQKPKKPSSGDSGGFGLDLDDALGTDLDLSDALDNVGGGTFVETDLLDVSGGDYKPDSSGRGKVDPTLKPKKPSSGDSGGFGVDLDDALGPDLDLSDALDNVGGGTFVETDLLDVSGGDYKPDSSGRGKVDPTLKPKKPSSGDSGGFGLDLDDALGTDLDLSDALDNVGGGTFVETDLLDVSGGDYKPDSSGRGKVDPTLKPKKPSSGDSGGFGLDLDDALGTGLDLSDPLDNVGGGTFDEADFLDVSGGDYKPDSSGRGKGHSTDSGYDHQGGGDQPQDLPWDQMLKMLNARLKEEFYMWISNLKPILTPRFVRVRDLLQAMP